MIIQKYILIAILVVYFLSLLVIFHFKFEKLQFKNTTTNSWNNKKFLIEATRLLKFKTQNYAMVQFNIANFRYLNESYGHKTGDKVLCCFSNVLKKHFIKENELYCSIWGDYFAVLLDYISDKELESRITKMANIFYNESLKICSFHCILKAGIVTSICNSNFKTEEYRNARNLLEKTNHVLNSLKEPYTTSIAFYTSESEKNITFFKKYIQSINKALQNNEFRAFFQPKYNIHTGRICGAEALVRWINNENVILLPDMFIPYCENSGFIIEIDRTIFEQTCKVLHERLKQNKPVVPISSNFSRLHAQNPDFPEYVTSIINKYEVPSNLIEIELTETIAGAHKDIVFENFRKLRKNGFIVAIDDFGSGYSSLAILEELEIDVIKMDQTFIHGNTIGLREFQVLSSMIHLAKNLGLTVVCEGIETPEHVLAIDKAGGEIAQGFFYSQPISSDLFNTELDKRDSDEGLKENVQSLQANFNLSFTEQLEVITEIEPL
jgi:diguanylate cyclase (GGDEF)-like protein